MPFDDDRHDGRSDTLEKMDKVIALLAAEDRWCKFFAESPGGRRCLWGAIWAEDAVAVLERPILDAIRQVTRRPYQSIDAFNDDLATTHALVLKVLHLARQNLCTATLAPAPRYPRASARFERGTSLELSFR